MGAVDIQINGFSGIDFNQPGLNAEALHTACVALKQSGVSLFLPTIITAALDDMAALVSAVVSARESDALAKEMIPGIHVEGPFINEQPVFAGAHPPDCITRADPERARVLVDAGRGLVKLVTLAPERDPGMATTRWLVDQGVCVAGGHCNPDLDTLDAALDAGMTLFTHLGNGCSPMVHRHDNIIQRVLSRADRLWISFIPDGVHIPLFALKNFLRTAGIERSIMVSDAIAAAACGPGTYKLGGNDIEVGEDGVARSKVDGMFAGSTVTWPEIMQNLRDPLALNDAKIRALTQTNPLAALNLQPKSGTTAATT